MSEGQRGEFRIEVEWIPVEGVSTPELRSTWARVQMYVGDACVTQVEDMETGASRRSIFVPVYPLAEWVAFNWWLLQDHVRPSFLPEYHWTFRSRAKHRGPRTEWLQHHNLRAIGDGFLWPDLSILPQDSRMRLVWRGDFSSPPYWESKFLASGTALVDANNVMAVLMQVVDETVVRLRESGVRSSSLEEEWSSLRAVQPEEAEFSRAAARLGLDPYSIPDAVSDLIIEASEELSAALLDDFLVAASPELLSQDLDWVRETSEGLTSTESESDPLPSLRLGTPVGAGQGVNAARLFRQSTKADDASVIDLDRWLPVTSVRRSDPALEGLAGLSANARPLLAVAGQRVSNSQRFAQGRSLYRFLAGDSDHLLVNAHTARQQAERAFAAELLAPARGIRALIGPDSDYVQDDDVASISQHFNVSEWVVRYQVMDQLGLDVDDPLDLRPRGGLGE